MGLTLCIFQGGRRSLFERLQSAPAVFQFDREVARKRPENIQFTVMQHIKKTINQ